MSRLADDEMCPECGHPEHSERVHCKKLIDGAHYCYCEGPTP